MMLSLLIVLLSTGAVQPQPVAAETVRTRPSEQSLPQVQMVTTSHQRPAQDIFVVEVEVRAASELLWSGPLRLSAGSPASLRRHITQAPAQACEDIRHGANSEQHSRNLTVSPQYARSDQPFRTSVEVQWQRPVAEACTSFGSRTVQLTQLVELNPGSWSTVTGDAGLVVRIRRR